MHSASIRLPSMGVYSLGWLEDHPAEAQRMLKACHGRAARCLCRRPHPKLYIAHRNGTYYLARFPETGPAHAPRCASYTPDPVHCGRGAYGPGAISERTDGRVSVKLGTPLDVVPPRTPSAPVPPRPAHVLRPRDDLTLAGLLHLLWDRARFNRWAPGMRGRRHYRQVHKFLLEAAEGVLVHRRPLIERLWIPEAFVASERDAIDARRVSALRRLSAPVRGRQRRVLAAGQLKSVTPDKRAGSVLRLAHTPPCLLLAAGPDATARLRRSAGPGLHDWPTVSEDSRVIVLLTMRRADEVWSVDRIAGLATDRHYLPISSAPDWQLTDHLVETGRYFYKPLAYDGEAGRYPTVLLTDAGREPVPLEISGSPDPLSPRRRRVAACRDAGRLCWHWDHTVTPNLPARSVPRPFQPRRAGAKLAGG